MIRISSACDMDQRFQRQWEFRRRDDDFDSSSDDSKSSSSSQSVLKKHKLVSNLMLLENDESSDTIKSQQEGLLDSGMGVHFEYRKAENIHIGLKKKTRAVKHKIKRDTLKGGNKEKSKCRTQEPVSLDDLSILADSILEELKVARENMFARMREEMRRLVAVESVPRSIREEGNSVQKKAEVRLQGTTETGIRTVNCNGGSLVRSVKRNKITDANCFCKAIEDKVNHGQTIEPITSCETEKEERLRLSVKKSMNSPNQSDPTGSSPYLVLPTVIPEPQSVKHRIDFSSSDYMQPGAAGNKTNRNVEKANLINDANNNHGYFSGIQLEEDFGSFSEMVVKEMSCFDQHTIQTSSMGFGLPIPLCQGLDNINVPGQIVSDNASRGNINGLKMHGGAIRFYGGNHALPEHFVVNNFSAI